MTTTTETSIDPRTEAEKARTELHAAVCREYREFARQLPEASAHRLFGLVAQRHGMTVPGIRKIIIKAGLYNPARQEA